MSLDDAIACSIPSSYDGQQQYRAPQAPPPPEWESVSVPLEPRRPHARALSNRKRKSIVKINEMHLDGVVDVLREHGPMTTAKVSQRYTALAANSIITAMYNLEDSGRVERAGRLYGSGMAIVWKLATVTR